MAPEIFIVFHYSYATELDKKAVSIRDSGEGRKRNFSFDLAESEMDTEEEQGISMPRSTVYLACHTGTYSTQCL